MRSRRAFPRVCQDNELLFAVTLHNIPEGMAVGVAFAGAVTSGSGITMAGALALSLGIAIQNFPEGAIISMPLKGEGMSKPKAFVMGVLSGVVEPIGGAITVLLAAQVVPLLPYLLSFAAGAMLYVVIEELIPESQMGVHSNVGTIGAAFGFLVMMILRRGTRLKMTVSQLLQKKIQFHYFLVLILILTKSQF